MLLCHYLCEISAKAEMSSVGIKTSIMLCGSQENLGSSCIITILCDKTRLMYVTRNVQVSVRVGLSCDLLIKPIVQKILQDDCTVIVTIEPWKTLVYFASRYVGGSLLMGYI